MDVRPAAVAGMFYPGEPEELAQTVDAFLRDAPTAGPPPKAIVAPHAGYAYSGPVAGRAFSRIVGAPVRRVVLLGPTHRVFVPGIALPGASRLRTPLGDVPVDAELVERLGDLPFVEVSSLAHAREHALEVELPFLQRALGAFSVLPLCVGGASPDQVAAVLDRVWGGPETLVVVSSDLSHYHGYDVARRLDADTALQIERLEPVVSEQACGAGPLNGLLLAARRRGMRVERLDLRSSGDTAGTRGEVVGYGAFALHEGMAA